MPSDERHSNYEATRLAARRLGRNERHRTAGHPSVDSGRVGAPIGSDRSELEDVEAGTGEMLIDTLSSLAEGLNVDVAFLFRDRTDDVH